MDFIRSHKLIVATVVIQIIALPLILLMVRQRQETQTSAQQSSVLFFNPASSTNSPITKNIGEEFSVDLMLNPGINLVSLAKIDVTYDPTKVTLIAANPVVVNAAAFPVTVEGPINTNGRMQIVVSVGSDQTKVIQTTTKVLTLTFKAVSAVNQTNIGFGANNELLSIAATDTSNENVLSSTTPAIIKVNSAPTSTPTPTNVPPTNTPTLTPTPTIAPTPTNTPTPTNSPTPTPTITQQSTPTPTLANTVINFSGVKLHGLGRGGDSPNPTSIGTLSPSRTSRSLTVEVYNTSGTLVNTVTGNIVYNGQQTGTFDGQVILPASINSGNYIIKIKSPFYLRRQLAGFMNIVKGQQNNAPSATLIAGDVNNDNALSVADYDLIMKCFSDLLPATNCTANEKLAADISDDGNVNADDYNLFLRELSVQSGD